MIIADLLMAGAKAVIEYVSAHVLTCLVPAFFIAGAMSALLPKEKIVRYLGQKVPKYKAYPLSIAAGLLLAVCSCTILPLFAGIKKKGAGTGPALAFLYTAPATNIMAILFTGSVLGWNFALARIILSVTFATLIGVIIAAIFKKEDIEEGRMEAPVLSGIEVRDMEKLPFLERCRLILFFTALLAILIVGTRVEGHLRYTGILGLIIILAILAKLFFKSEEIRAWFFETWGFTKKI